MNKDKLNTGQKALQINLDAKKYGTFAEIGAGQEVARWFFHVGKASGTVAKTISAYDMAVSDAIYGPSDRYVSRMRLQAMLDHEFDLLLQRLDKTHRRPAHVFRLRQHRHHQAYCQGRRGRRPRLARHQISRPSRAASRPPSSSTRGCSTGKPPASRKPSASLGVNLIHGAFYQHLEPERLIGSLLDSLSWQRIEVDMIKFSGPAFAGVDNRLMALQLVAAMAHRSRHVHRRRRDRHPQRTALQKTRAARTRQFPSAHQSRCSTCWNARRKCSSSEPALQGEAPVVMFEMTLRQLQVGDAIDHRDFLDRVDTLGALGKPVLISNFLRYHRLVTYLSRHTQKPIGLPIGLRAPARRVRRKILHRPARRPHGIARPAFQKRRETLRLSLARQQNRQADHRGKPRSRARTCATSTRIWSKTNSSRTSPITTPTR